YFRARFDLSAFPYDLSFARVRLRHIVDDGAVFYLNGKEISRFNMAPGTVNFSTLSTAAQTYEATCTTVPDFLATNLVKGVNVLAAELHHAPNDNNDPDIVMGAALDIAVASERPSLQITRPVSPPNSVRVSWAPGQCYTLEAAT